MTGEVSARAITPNSADLTMTTEYLVVKGKHYRVNNNYLYRSKQTLAIKAKDLLNMEYLTLRSKRLLIAFIILMTLVVFGASGMRKLISVTRQIDREVQKVENVYNYVAEEDIEINLTGSVKNIFSSLGITGIIAIYISLIFGSVGCLSVYLFKPYRVLYISSLGSIVAVEKKYYNKSQLDDILNTWETQLRE